MYSTFWLIVNNTNILTDHPSVIIINFSKTFSEKRCCVNLDTEDEHV